MEKKETAKTEEGTQKPKGAANTEIMTFDRYSETERPDLHRYAKSYLRALHNGRMKSKEDWDAEMAFHGLAAKE